MHRQASNRDAASAKQLGYSIRTTEDNTRQLGLANLFGDILLVIPSLNTQFMACCLVTCGFEAFSSVKFQHHDLNELPQKILTSLRGRLNGTLDICHPQWLESQHND